MTHPSYRPRSAVDRLRAAMTTGRVALWLVVAFVLVLLAGAWIGGAQAYEFKTACEAKGGVVVRQHYRAALCARADAFITIDAPVNKL